MRLLYIYHHILSTDKELTLVSEIKPIKSEKNTEKPVCFNDPRSAALMFERQQAHALVEFLRKASEWVPRKEIVAFHYFNPKLVSGSQMLSYLPPAYMFRTEGTNHFVG